MTEDTNIVIKLDEKVIQEQIQNAIWKEFAGFAAKLRVAADHLDGFEFAKDQGEYFDKRMEDEYQRGLKDGQGIIKGLKDMVQ